MNVTSGSGAAAGPASSGAAAGGADAPAAEEKAESGMLRNSREDRNRNMVANAAYREGGVRR